MAPVSRLTTVMQCDGQGACLPPTVFTWEGGDIAFPGTQSNGLAGLCRNGSTDLGVCNDADNFDSLQYPDINGDGITDVCYRGDQGIQCLIGDWAGGWSMRISTGICANGSTAYGVCNDSDNFGTIRFVDLNADGRSDLFYRGDLGIRVHLSTGTGFQVGFSSSVCANASRSYGVCNDSDNHYSLQLVEINGDGEPDLCYRADSGIQCFLGDGQGGFSTQIATDICANGSAKYGVCNDADNFNSIRFLDLNGDGLQDLFYRGDQGIQVHFSTGSGFRLASSSPICANSWTGHGVCNDSDNHTLIYNPDINADGVPDLCYRGDRGIHCHVADGAGRWIQERATDICANGSTKYGVCNDSDDYATIRFADLNNDGYTDLLYRGDAGIRVHLNTGTGFVDAVATPICRNGACFNLNSIALADINADAQADLLMLESDGLKVWMQQDFRPRLVTRITDSLGASTQISYKPLTDPTVYDPAVTLGEREIAIRGPLRVVSATETSDGLGGTNRTRYRYGGVKANRDGRGLLGFAWEQVTDEATGRTSTTEYRQDFPFAGTPWRTLSYLANGDLISDNTVTLASRTTAGRAVMPYAAETVAKSYEPGGRLLSTVITRQTGHDAYGNVGTIDISTTAGSETFRKVTSSTCRNIVDSNRWLLGRLTRAQVTHIDASGGRAVKTSAFTYFEASHGLLQQEIIEPDSTAPGIRQTTTYEYDRFGNVTRATVAGSDSAGRAISRSTQKTYTADGRFAQSAANALGHTERYSYDARFGEPVELTGPNAQTTRWTFDGFGRKTAERRAEGTATLWERAWITSGDAAAPPHAVYRLAEQVTAAADSQRLPPVVQYLDEKGRVLRSVGTGFDGSIIYQDTEYDNRGREVAKSLPYFAGDEPYWAETFYDDLDRVVRKVAETSRQVHITSLAYHGLKTTETDSLGREKSTWTNAEGKVVAVQEEEGASVEYDYDPRGNLIRTVQGDDGSGKTAESTIAYDQRDRKIAMQDADQGRWTYGYNSFGGSEWQQDALGNRTELVYDALGRTVQRTDRPAGGTA